MTLISTNYLYNERNLDMQIAEGCTIGCLCGIFCCNKWSNFPSLALLSCAIFVAFSFLVSFPSCTCRLTSRRLCHAVAYAGSYFYSNKFIFHWASQNPPCPFFIIIIANEVRHNGIKSEEKCNLGKGDKGSDVFG